VSERIIRFSGRVGDCPAARAARGRLAASADVHLLIPPFPEGVALSLNDGDIGPNAVLPDGVGAPGRQGVWLMPFQKMSRSTLADSAAGFPVSLVPRLWLGWQALRGSDRTLRYSRASQG